MLTGFLNTLATIISVTSLLIVTYGALIGVISFFRIASDILKTVLEPTLNELAILGGIVVLRTVLSVFLNKEIKELDTENKDTE